MLLDSESADHDSESRQLARQATNTVRLFLTCDDELRSPQQGTFDLGIGELADRVPCRLSVLRRANIGRFYRAVSRQNVENIGVGYAIECSILQNGLDLSLLIGSATLKRVDHGHSDLALAQVACDRLTENALGGGQVEYVVHYLECHSQVAPVLR